MGFTRIEGRAADAQARVILLRHSADVSARKDLAKQVARLARGSSDPYWRFAPVMNCIFEAGRAGDLTELEVLCDQMSDIVERGPSGRLRWLHWLTVAVLHLDRGELAASDRASERAAREGTAGGVADAVHVHAFQQCVAAFHRRSIGPFAPYVEEMLATTPSLSFAWAVLTLAHAQLGDRERTLAEAARTWQRLVDDPTDEYRPFSVAVLIQALAELAPDARLPLPLLRDLTDALAPFAGQFVTAGSILASAGPARRYLGLAAWLRGDRIGAETLLWAAATEASDHGMPLWRLRSLTDLVRVLADGDAHTEASALAATLHPEASTLGLTPCLATLHAALD